MVSEPTNLRDTLIQVMKDAVEAQFAIIREMGPIYFKTPDYEAIADRYVKVIDQQLKSTLTPPPPTEEYVVRFTERERGWGGDVWETGYPTEQQARAACDECNEKYAGQPTVPEYYIIAEYKGKRAVKKSEMM